MRARHVYCKGFNGYGLFYSLGDYLLFFTLYSVLSREMGICTISFSMMFNHVHELLWGVHDHLSRLFQRRLEIIFALHFNKEHKRKGKVFRDSFGYADKWVQKKILGCIAYIFNNVVAGRMVSRAVENRWTLLAYYKNRSPFSEPIVIRKCSAAMKRAIQLVNTYYEANDYLDYPVQRRIYKGLSVKERRQITDYIISKYNFLDYSVLEELYGSFDSLLNAVDSNAGAEYDLNDEYGDHSCYGKMLSIARQSGYGIYEIEKMNENALAKFADLLLKSVNPGPEQLKKFLRRNLQVVGNQ